MPGCEGGVAISGLGARAVQREQERGRERRGEGGIVDLEQQGQEEVLQDVKEEKDGDECVALNFKCEEPFDLFESIAKRES